MKENNGEILVCHHHGRDMAFFNCDICYFMKIDIHVLLSNIILHLARKNVEVALRIVKLYFKIINFLQKCNLHLQF